MSLNQLERRSINEGHFYCAVVNVCVVFPLFSGVSETSLLVIKPLTVRIKVQCMSCPAVFVGPYDFTDEENVNRITESSNKNGIYCITMSGNLAIA